jgi:dihydrofolate reductase
MKAIVVVDNRWGIGAKNDLLFSLKEDMRHFRQLTAGKTVMMGYNTLLSFPEGKPLKNRVNIVLAPEGVTRSDCTVVHTLPELQALVATLDSDDLFVIGGAMFYHTMLPFCDTVYVTKVAADGGAAVFFDNLDQLPQWYLAEQGDPIADNGQTIRFCTYRNRTPLPF